MDDREPVNNALRDFALDEALGCSGVEGADDEEIRWFLYRTANPVRDKGEVGKTALTKLTFEGVSGGEVQTVLVHSGGWDDFDENNMPNGDEEVGCFGSADTSIQVGNIAQPVSTTELKEQYGE